MRKIFFSYTLKDGEINKNFLYQIKNWLNKQNIDSFIDLIDNEYDTTQFQVKLIEELKKCDLLFVIDTIKYDESMWTSIEIEEAKKINKLIIRSHYSIIQNVIKNNYKFDYFIN